MSSGKLKLPGDVVVRAQVLGQTGSVAGNGCYILGSGAQASLRSSLLGEPKCSDKRTVTIDTAFNSWHGKECLFEVSQVSETLLEGYIHSVEDVELLVRPKCILLRSCALDNAAIDQSMYSYFSRGDVVRAKISAERQRRILAVDIRDPNCGVVSCCCTNNTSCILLNKGMVVCSCSVRNLSFKPVEFLK